MRQGSNQDPGYEVVYLTSERARRMPPFFSTELTDSIGTGRALARQNLPTRDFFSLFLLRLSNYDRSARPVSSLRTAETANFARFGALSRVHWITRSKSLRLEKQTPFGQQFRHADRNQARFRG